jgi:hypothetical protein
MTKEHTKGTRGRGRPQEHLHGMPYEKTESAFELDYVVTKKDLEHLATKLDLKDLEIRMLTTMATKTEMRMLIGGLYLLMIVGLAVLTYMGYGSK